MNIHKGIDIVRNLDLEKSFNVTISVSKYIIILKVNPKILIRQWVNHDNTLT